MVDTYVSFSNSNDLDLFPTFKSFLQPKSDQNVLSIEKKGSTIDVKSTDSFSLQPEPQTNNLKSNTVKKSTSSNFSVQCDICSVPISSEVVYRTHINGRKHQTILAALIAKNPQYKQSTYDELCAKSTEIAITTGQKQSNSTSSIDNQTPLIPLKQIHCDICNVTCNSQQMFDKHLTGKRHQMKLKSMNINNSPSVRTIPDNNPSSSNYCDVCSLQLKSENELTEHLAHPRHQLKVKDAEICAKAAVEMKINFDDYKISTSSSSITTTTENNPFQYECIKCNKKMNDKVQLISHLKSASHSRLNNQANRQLDQKNFKPGKYQAKAGGAMKHNINNRNPNTAKKSFRQPRPYPLSRPPRTQPYKSQTSADIFGAFDPTNQVYSSTNTSLQYDNIPDGYDGFFPKSSNSHDDGMNRSRYFASTHGYDYSQASESYTTQTTNYSDQSNTKQSSWQYQNQFQYDKQQYSNQPTNYGNPTYYSSNQPPLPNYEQPPVPNYPPPLSQDYSQNLNYGGANQNQTNNQYYSSFSFRQ